MILLPATALAGTVGYLTHIILSTETNEITTKFYRLMDSMKIQNNKEQTYSVLKTIKKEYGYDMIVGIPVGLSYNKLENILPEIKDYLCADIIMNKAKTSNSAYMRIAMNLNDKDVPMTEKIRFKWHRIMEGANIKNHAGDTFRIRKVVENDELGYGVLVEIPESLTVNKLRELLPVLEDNFNSNIIINDKITTNSVQLIMIPKDIDLNKLSYKNQIILKWFETTIKCDISNKQGEYFALRNIKETSYGFEAEVACPINLYVDVLYKNKQYLENGLGGQVVITKINNTINIKVNNKINTKYPAIFQDIIYFKWYNLMDILSLRTKQSFETFILINIHKREYGFECDLIIPDGLDFKELQKNQETLENNLRAFIEIEWKRLAGKIHMKVANVEITDNDKFVPIKTELNHMYLATTYFRENLIVNLKEDPHFGFWGTSSSGKSFCQQMVITNHIYYHSPDELWLYFSQISEKKDYDEFKNLKHTRYYAETLEDTKLMLAHLLKISEERNKILRKYNCKDIWIFRKKYTTKYWQMILLCSDEFSYFMPAETDDKSLAKLKAECLEMFRKIAATARNVGIFFITSTQRPDKMSIMPQIKMNLNVKFNFRQATMASALTSMDDGKCLGLPQREAWVEYAGQQKYIRTFYCDETMFSKYLEPSKEENHQYCNLSKALTYDPYSRRNKVKENKIIQKKKSGDLCVMSDED